MFSEHGIVIRNNKERENMTDTFFATSIEHLVTTKDGDTFIVSSSFGTVVMVTLQKSQKQTQSLVLRTVVIPLTS